MNLKDCRLLVTPTSYGRNDPRLKTDLEAQVGQVTYNPTGKPLTSAEVRDLLPGVDGYIAGLDVIDSAALSGADRLKVISRYGVGVDEVDLAAAKARGIVVTNTPGANSASVAELALGMILALARHLPEAMEAMHLGKWPRITGLSLEAKTVGILGLGAIGRQLVRRLQGFDCRIVAHDPSVDGAEIAAMGVELTGMDEVLGRSDFVSLHLPLLPETRGMVNDEFLAKVKPGGYLINTARGEIIDEDALLRALRSGRLRGVGLDAFVKEPPDPDSPLLKLPQVLATPHLGAMTDGATSNMGWMAMRDCLAVLKNEAPAHAVA
jgi:D-3-phosphoglycerate dehydrogenase